MVEKVLVDERMVSAGEFFAVVGDVAQVVAVAQHSGQLADRYPLGWVPGSGSGA
jgi:hypothetical protein